MIVKIKGISNGSWHLFDNVSNISFDNKNFQKPPEAFNKNVGFEEFNDYDKSISIVGGGQDSHPNCFRRVAFNQENERVLVFYDTFGFLMNDSGKTVEKLKSPTSQSVIESSDDFGLEGEFELGSDITVSGNLDSNITESFDFQDDFYENLLEKLSDKVSSENQSMKPEEFINPLADEDLENKKQLLRKVKLIEQIKNCESEEELERKIENFLKDNRMEIDDDYINEELISKVTAGTESERQSLKEFAENVFINSDKDNLDFDPLDRVKEARNFIEDIGEILSSDYNESYKRKEISKRVSENLSDVPEDVRKVIIDNIQNIDYSSGKIKENYDEFIDDMNEAMDPSEVFESDEINFSPDELNISNQDIVDPAKKTQKIKNVKEAIKRDYSDLMEKIIDEENDKQRKDEADFDDPESIKDKFKSIQDENVNVNFDMEGISTPRRRSKNYDQRSDDENSSKGVSASKEENEGNNNKKS